MFMSMFSLVVLATGSSRGRGSWNSRESYQRSSSYHEDEWQVARGSRRSFREEDVRWNDHVPEWSNDDSIDFKTVGTFDSSGAFMSKKVRMCLNMWIFLQFVCDIGALLQKKITPVCVGEYSSWT